MMSKIPTLTNEYVAASEFADLALDIATTLLASGAHCGRITRNLNRMAKHWNLEVQMQLTFTGVVLTVTSEFDPQHTVTRYHNTPPHSVHLELLTEFSRLTWKVADGDLTFEEVKKETERIKKVNHYNYWCIAVAVGLSCACLCLLAGGNLTDAIIACVAAFAGSMIRVFILHHNFNPMISFVIASFVTTMIAGTDMMFRWGAAPETTLATAVLYLVPGVPLINSLIDLIEGYLSSAWNRALFGASILLCIAVGMTLSIALLGINNF
jgi:uncharacterized membrane protein YjjP (DUF1212 family)